MINTSDKEAKLNRLRRPRDSFLTKFFARPVSRHITLALESTPVTPLQVTITGFALALIAAYTITLLEWHYLILAALLVELAHILDCVDGELARLTDRGSLFAANIDPITDRAKDAAIIYAAYAFYLDNNIFQLHAHTISLIAYSAVSLWFLYVYIVDAYTNPMKAKTGPQNSTPAIYIGLYDLFIYGSIFFLVTNTFHLFLFYILFLSITGILYQLYYMKSN